jgi:hypothetical protein
MKRILFLALGVAGLGLGQAPPEPNVRVISATGKWMLAGKVLARRDTLRSGDVVHLDGTGSLLVECDRRELYSYSSPCPAPSCNVTVCAKDGPAAGKTLGSNWTVSGLLTREPRDPVVAAGRAGGNPNDAVVLADERGVHWGPALARVLEGETCLRVTPVAATAPSTRTVRFDWDRARDDLGTPPTPAPPSGLYEIQKGAAGAACAADPDATPVWVLIVPAAQFERANGAWTTAAADVARFQNDGVPLPALVALRRATLAFLDDQRTRP